MGAFAAGCGGDDNGTPATGDDAGPDATQIQPGDDSGMPGTDGGKVGSPDGGGGADADAAPPAPVHGKLILVHASAYAPALRFCFGSVNIPDGGDAGTITVTPSYPAPNTVLGVPPGTGGPAADTSVDLANRTLEHLRHQRRRDGPRRPERRRGHRRAHLRHAHWREGSRQRRRRPAMPLVQGVDYWDLGTLQAGTLADGTTTLARRDRLRARRESAHNAQRSPTARCGLRRRPTGNLGLWATKLDTTTALDGGSLGAQFAYASFPFASESTLVNGAAAVAGFYMTTLVTPEAGAPRPTRATRATRPSKPRLRRRCR